MKEHIQAAEVFAGISTASVGLLADSGTWTLLDTGETLYSVGDEADAIYLVVEGLLSVSPQAAAGQQTVMTELGPGDIAGMVQILTGGRRIATMRAVTASRLAPF